jgi:hypothetical protein
MRPPPRTRSPTTAPECSRRAQRPAGAGLERNELSDPHIVATALQPRIGASVSQNLDPPKRSRACRVTATTSTKRHPAREQSRTHNGRRLRLATRQYEGSASRPSGGPRPPGCQSSPAATKRAEDRPCSPSRDGDRCAPAGDLADARLGWRGGCGHRLRRRTGLVGCRSPQQPDKSTTLYARCACVPKRPGTSPSVPLKKQQRRGPRDYAADETAVVLECRRRSSGAGSNPLGQTTVWSSGSTIA